MKRIMPEILNRGSLMTYRVPGEEKETCFAELLIFEGKGIWEPTFGKMDVTKEEAEAHNKCLDEAMLDGLDKVFEIGQGASFYFSAKTKRVVTFCGTLVSANVSVSGQVITFHRGGKMFRGRLRKAMDLFNFRRVS